MAAPIAASLVTLSKSQKIAGCVLANIGAEAWIQGYGRENEMQADELGLKYATKSGYRPEAMAAMFKILRAQETFELQRAKDEGREPNIYHGVFDSHPAPDARAVSAAKASGSSAGGSPSPRASAPRGAWGSAGRTSTSSSRPSSTRSPATGRSWSPAASRSTTRGAAPNGTAATSTSSRSSCRTVATTRRGRRRHDWPRGTGPSPPSTRAPTSPADVSGRCRRRRPVTSPAGVASRRRRLRPGRRAGAPRPALPHRGRPSR